MKILAVDDDPFILGILREIVSHIGDHTLETALSGLDALVIAREQGDFDCFMLDIQMPGMNGIELCRALRLVPGYALTPMLMLTAMSEKRHIDQAFLAGATDYLSKPFEITELRARLGVLRKLADARRQTGETLVATPSGHRAGTHDYPLSMHQPFEIRDIDGIVDAVALENYVTKLSRARLFVSSIFAISIRRIEQLFVQTSPFDFQCLIVDVAEALSDTLSHHSFLAAYVGNGSFVCVVEGGVLPDFSHFTDRLNLAIHRLDMHCSDGGAMKVRVSTGHPIRNMWRSGATASDALSQAVNSAEAQARSIKNPLDNIWSLGERA